MNKKIILILAGVISAGLSNVSVAAPDSHSGYLLNSSGGIINLNGKCMHTGDWTPEMAVPECDPDIAAANQLKKATEHPPEKKPGPVIDSPQPKKAETTN